MMEKRLGNLLSVFLLVGLFLVVTLNISFVKADGLVIELLNISNPISWGNYSTTVNVSIRTSYLVPAGTLTNNYNVTLYCNKSGGAVYASSGVGVPAGTGVDIIKIITMTNTSSTQTVFENASVRINNIIPFSNESRIFNCSVFANNYTNVNWSSGNTLMNITFDSTPPNVSFIAASNYRNFSSNQVIIINASVIDTGVGIDRVYFNVTFSNGTQVNFTRASNSTNFFNITLDLSNFQEGFYNVTIYANDSFTVQATKTTGYANGTNLNNTEFASLIFDKTGPVGSYSCTPSDAVSVGDSLTCSCSVSDAVSGVNSSSVSSTVSPPTGSPGAFPIVCSFADMLGNLGSAGFTYHVDLTYYPPSGGGTTTTTVTNTPKISSFSEIAPGTTATMNNFNVNTGVKEIDIQVSSAVQNVQVTVTKYDSQPSAVSVAKTGKVFSYLQVSAPLLQNKVSAATIKLQVPKTWTTANSVDKNNVALFRFDSGAWNALTTTYTSEDTNYYYYDAQTPGFSYFAIGEATAASTNTQTPAGTPPTVTGGWSANYLMWIALGVIVLIAAGVVLFLKTKKRR